VKGCSYSSHVGVKLKQVMCQDRGSLTIRSWYIWPRGRQLSYSVEPLTVFLGKTLLIRAGLFLYAQGDVSLPDSDSLQDVARREANTLIAERAVVLEEVQVLLRGVVEPFFVLFDLLNVPSGVLPRAVSGPLHVEITLSRPGSLSRRCTCPG